MSLGRLHQYNPREISLIVCGIPVQGGYADGVFFNIEPHGPRFTLQKGTDGSVTRSDTGENCFTLTLSLMQSNPLNAVLSALLTLDSNTPNGAGVAPTMCKDRIGTSMFTAPASFIEGWPPESFGREASERVWTIQAVAGNAPHVVGGNG